MNLLILTQKVDRNDDVLGFFHRWIEAFAKNYGHITVICLEKGEVSLPQNVSVFSLGKETKVSRLAYVFNFYKYSWQQRKKYDAVFVHMNPVYAALGGLFWKLQHKKIALWYSHKQVDLKLRFAVRFADVIFTSTPQSFGLPGPKVRFVGHGIDTELFAFKEKEKEEKAIPSIVHVGRISRIKNCHILIEAAVLLKKKCAKPFLIEFIGTPITDDDVLYKSELDMLIASHSLGPMIRFNGRAANRNIPAAYYAASVTANMAPTGGMDKAVLESFAAGTPVVVCNESFASFLGPYKGELMFACGDPEELAQKLCALLSEDPREIADYCQRKVREAFSVDALIAKITQTLR